MPSTTNCRLAMQKISSRTSATFAMSRDSCGLSACGVRTFFLRGSSSSEDESTEVAPCSTFSFLWHRLWLCRLCRVEQPPDVSPFLPLLRRLGRPSANVGPRPCAGVVVPHEPATRRAESPSATARSLACTNMRAYLHTCTLTLPHARTHARMHAHAHTRTQ